MPLNTFEILYASTTVRRRMLPLSIIILLSFIVIFFKTIFILQQVRRELDETNFLFYACHENLKALTSNSSGQQQNKKLSQSSHYLKSSRLRSMLSSINGTRTITGLYNLKPLQPTNFILPHLKRSERSLLPAFLMSGGRSMVDIVIGVTTVKRDKADYLMNTLKELVGGLSDAEKICTLIVVMVGEVDIEYVLTTARNIESNFTDEVNAGLIDVISPLKYYYPTEEIPATLGDSVKRTLWRAKHVLDCVYVMAYGHTKGSYYLIMEDDIIAKKGYLTEIKQVIGFTSRYNKNWLIIEFCQQLNGMGKLLRSSDVDHFIKYLQLFYYNMPLDFLIESYLQDKVCGITKRKKTCDAIVNGIRAKSTYSLFSHIGLYSSLKGKIQKVEESRLITGFTYFPHSNPPLKCIISTIASESAHTIQMAYEGKSYFLGQQPKKGAVIEFWFKKPTAFKRYKFRSGNYQHSNYIFYNTIVEVKSVIKNFTKIGKFDEFGLSERSLIKFNALAAIRLRMLDDNRKNVIISEIQLVTKERT